MHAIEVFAPPSPSAAPADQPFPPERVGEILRAALRQVLGGDADPHRTPGESSAAALACLSPREEGPPPRCGSAGPFAVAHYRGEVDFFPSDLASLFYLAGAHLKIQAGLLTLDPYLERDILRMMRAGDLDAANLIFDRLTGTLSGPELPESNLQVFARRRTRLDALLRAAGIPGTRIGHKVWDRPPFGRDAQLLQAPGGRDNRITALSVAFLLAHALEGKLGGEEGSARLLELLRQDPGSGPPRSRLRLLERLQPRTRAWGRRTAGPRILHEAAAVELPCGTRFVMTFLSYLGEKQEGILEELGRIVADALSRG